MMGNADQLRQAIDLTDRIMVAIEQVELDAVSELDQQRQKLLKQYYQDQQAIDVELTRQLKQANDQLVSRLSQMQQQTRKRQLELRQSTQASLAYRANLPK